MDWSWAVAGITEETPRTTGPECINYMTNRRRWIEAVLFSLLFIYWIYWAVKRMDPIIVPPLKEVNKPHSAIRLLLLISMTFIFGVEMGFKFAGQSVIFVMNPCHIQTLLQIYLLAAKPSKTTIALFRIQMNNLNGPFLAFLFPEVESRTFHFEQASYWIQHALLYIIPVYILKSGAYPIEDISDYNWVTIGIAVMLLYHFVILNALSIFTGINLNHMLCAALADPFQGQNYRIAAVIHESILCPILNKVTVILFSKSTPLNSSRKPKPTLELRVNRTCERRVSTDDALLSERIYHQRDHLSISTPSTPCSSLASATSALSEMSLAAEMAAAIAAGSGPVTTMRRLKRNSVSEIGDNRIRDPQNVNGIYNAEEDIVGEFIFSKEANVATALSAECTMPTTKID